MNIVYFAAATGNSDVLASLGIDWKTLIIQGVGFLLLIVVMAKWVMPPLLKAVDDRQDKIEKSVKAAETAEKSAQKAEETIEQQLAIAQKDAADILATAHDEAAATLEKAHAKAKADAEHIVQNAHDQVEKDIVAARQALKKDTLELVALATEKVVGASVSKSVDKQLIEQSLKAVSGAK